MQRFGPPLPTHALHWLHFQFPRFDLIACNPQTWSGFKACMCCRDIAFPLFEPLSGRDRVTHGTHLPDCLPLIQLWNHHARAAKVLESGRIGASLGIHHLPAKRVQNGKNAARMAKGAHAAPPPHIFLHSLTSYDICTCCAWLGLEMGPASGRKC